MFGIRLRKLRTTSKLTQKQLADKINVTHVSISGYESGNRTPDTDTLQKIAQVFDVSTDYLLGRTDDPSPTSKKSSGGRAFLGGADNYTEEELEIAELAAQAAIEALRRSRASKKQ